MCCWYGALVPRGQQNYNKSYIFSFYLRYITIIDLENSVLASSPLERERQQKVRNPLT